MKIRELILAAALFVTATEFTACGGGSSSSSPAAPATSPIASTPDGEIPLTGVVAIAALGSGYSASVTLPVGSVSTTATVVKTTYPPPGTGPAPGTALFYAAITPAAAVTYSTGTVSGSCTSLSALAGTFTLDLLAPGLGWLQSTPGTVLGNTVMFNYALTQPITLSAGTTYVFAISQM